MAAVVNGLPPLVAQRVTPVDALRRLDLEDQRFVGLEFEAADDRPVLRGGADRCAIDRGMNPLAGGPALKSRKNLRLSWTNSPKRIQLARHRDVRSTERSVRFDLDADALDL